MFKSLIAFCLSRRPIVVVGLLLFAGAGLVAFKMLNIEAYPNPTPVILEITAQAPGLSAEEMERYYTRPMEIGLYTTPGIDIIRSTSFYGLSLSASASNMAWITSLPTAQASRWRCAER
jgi:heavy metal efflux system protein